MTITEVGVSKVRFTTCKYMRRFLCLCLLVLAVSASAGTLAQFRMFFGDIEVELYDQDKPVTVRNFVRYVKSGAYRDMFFHRGIPGFVIQGGGFFTTNRFSNTDLSNVFIVPNFGMIPNEFGVGRRFSNTYGTIAMAKLGGNTNSASSQFFFNLTNNAFLDANDTNNLFTVFGKVVRGTNTLNVFNNLSYGNGILNLGTNKFGGLFSDLPVSYTGSFYPWHSDLIYVDVSLLNVQVQLGLDRTKEISWQSVSNRLNSVEYTSFTNFPPRWDTLVMTNGTGSMLKVVDSSTNALKRFYRIRVDY